MATATGPLNSILPLSSSGDGRTRTRLTRRRRPRRNARGVPEGKKRAGRWREREGGEGRDPCDRPDDDRRADATAECVPPRSHHWHHLTFAPVRNVGRNSLPGGRPRDSDRGDLRGSYACPPSVPPSSPVCARGPKVNRDPAIKPPPPPAPTSSAPDCTRGARALWRRYLFYMVCHKWGSAHTRTPLAHTVHALSHTLDSDAGGGHAHSSVLRSIREEGKGGSERATMQCHVAFFLPLFLFVSRFVLPSLPSSHCGPNTNAPRPPPPMSLVGMFSRIISRISRLLYLCSVSVVSVLPRYVGTTQQ